MIVCSGCPGGSGICCDFDVEIVVCDWIGLHEEAEVRLVGIAYFVLAVVG